jgi:putative GTP pyrophosphokinase
MIKFVNALHDKDAFLKKFGVSTEKFEKSGLEWDALEKIYKDYVRLRPSLQPTLNYVREQLGTIDKVHSIKARLKDPEHLIEKIIRKASDAPEQAPTSDNYREKIPDLVGIRALHLFKSDWASIHDSIASHWTLVEKPEAKIREGDNPEFVRQFEERGCQIKKTPAGYRSVHYVIESRPSKERVLVEIQVRTLFEEGWSEVDHQVRYPYGAVSPIVGSFLDVFNRLAGGADEMASFIVNLQAELRTLVDERASAANQLNKLIGDLKIESEQKAKLQVELERLRPKLIETAGIGQTDLERLLRGFVVIKNPSKVTPADASSKAVPPGTVKKPK